jgi:hypothetical protein
MSRSLRPLIFLCGGILLGIILTHTLDSRNAVESFWKQWNDSALQADVDAVMEHSISFTSVTKQLVRSQGRMSVDIGTEHGVRCSTREIAKMARSEPIKNSNCPNNTAWVKVLLDETSSLSSATILSIGCNKGDDFVAEMRDWSGDDLFSVTGYQAELHKNFPKFRKNAYGQNGYKGAEGYKGGKRGIHGFCVEPMPKNYRLLETSGVVMFPDGPTYIVWTGSKKRWCTSSRKRHHN